MWTVECSLLHRRVQGSFFSQGAHPTFMKTLYTLSVLLKPTSPNSIPKNLAWKVLKGDTIRLQPRLIIIRVYTPGCHKDYKADWLRRGLSHSFWRRELLVCNLVFISPGGQFGRRYVILMATRHMVQNSLKVQGGVSFFFKMQSAWPVPFLLNPPPPLDVLYFQCEHHSSGCTAFEISLYIWVNEVSLSETKLTTDWRIQGPHNRINRTTITMLI